MYKIVNGYQENLHELMDQMFQHRAKQFSDRLGWNVSVDKFGLETDEYDDDDSIYVIVHTRRGSHLGSMRLRSTLKSCMCFEAFEKGFVPECMKSEKIWECSRFCLSPGAPRETAAKLLALGAMLVREHSLLGLLGVFDAKMIRIYERLGASPKLLSQTRASGETIFSGIWIYSDDSYSHLVSGAGMNDLEAQVILANSTYAASSNYEGV